MRNGNPPIHAVREYQWMADEAENCAAAIEREAKGE